MRDLPFFCLPDALYYHEQYENEASQLLAGTLITRVNWRKPGFQNRNLLAINMIKCLDEISH